MLEDFAIRCAARLLRADTDQFWMLLGHGSGGRSGPLRSTIDDFRLRPGPGLQILSVGGQWPVFNIDFRVGSGRQQLPVRGSRGGGPPGIRRRVWGAAAPSVDGDIL